MIRGMVRRPRLFGRQSSGVRLRNCQALPRILPLLLAVLLVVFQTGAMLHALDHVSDAGRSDSPALPHHAACVLCVAYAGSDGALASAPLSMVFLLVLALGPRAHRARIVQPFLVLPYQIRAPPAFAVV